MTSEQVFRNWVADRLVFVYGESPNVDYVLKLRAEPPSVRLRTAAAALLDDVRRRYPGQELRCEFMRALDDAVKAEK